MRGSPPCSPGLAPRRGAAATSWPHSRPRGGLRVLPGHPMGRAASGLQPDPAPRTPHQPPPAAQGKEQAQPLPLPSRCAALFCPARPHCALGQRTSEDSEAAAACAGEPASMALPKGSGSRCLWATHGSPGDRQPRFPRQRGQSPPHKGKHSSVFPQLGTDTPYWAASHLLSAVGAALPVTQGPSSQQQLGTAMQLQGPGQAGPRPNRWHRLHPCQRAVLRA